MRTFFEPWAPSLPTMLSAKEVPDQSAKLDVAFGAPLCLRPRALDYPQ